MEGYIGSHGQYDSTGIFTTIPAIASGLMGILIGHMLERKDIEIEVKLIWMFIIACTFLMLGWAFSYEFPMITRLWISSYVLFTSGIAVICFATSFWFLDVQKYPKGIKPFIAFGTNALTAYFVAGIFGQLITRNQFISFNSGKISPKEWLFNEVHTSVFNPYNASFAYLILNTLLILIWYMYKRNKFIKV
ncbi:hypothetical protein DHD32_14150 [Arenibacter sp. TNZ]|uniref:hypothetical protein n=1 Tax=Arenibacter TaxID=178469 RepID=UPI000CD3DC7D|nr:MULTISPECIES: hypothetical protein [Arenibacter]MCM4172630.1 hypothetical protein [Arenibacter sp. TNZ]